MIIFQRVIVSTLVGICAAYLLHGLGDKVSTFAIEYRALVLPHVEFVGVVTLLLSLLVLPKVYRYGLEFESYTWKNQKFFLHELDAVLVAVAVFVFSVLFLTDTSPLSVVHKGIDYSKFAPFLCFYILYEGIALSFKENTRSIIRIFCFCVVWSVTQGGFFLQENAIQVIIGQVVLLICVLYGVPWKLFEIGINFVKDIRGTASTAIFMLPVTIKWVASDGGTSNAKFLLGTISRSVWLWLFRKNRGGTEDFNDNVLLNDMLAGFEGRRGHNSQDKIYRKLKRRFLKGKPLLVSDTENYPVDIIGRKKCISDLCDRITSYLNASNSMASITMGVFGEWGDGKSYVINRTLRQIELDNSNIICVVTYPWQFFLEKTDQGAVENFLSRIEIAVSKHIRSAHLRSLFRKYAKQLSGNIRFSLPFGSFNYNSSQDPQETQKEISNYLLEYNKKMVVVLEDIDRLSQEELLVLFRLVRLCSDLKNTIFLLPCDKEKIDQYIASSGLDISYLQKFIQDEYRLPPIDNQSIRSYIFDDLCEQWCDDDGGVSENFVEKAIDEVTKRPDFFTLVKNLRHAKRLVNGVAQSYLNVHGEVSLEDFIELEVIKQNISFLYTDIINNYKYYYPRLDTKFYINNQSTLEQVCQEHVKEVFAKNECKGHVLDSGTGILERLYPHLSDANVKTDNGRKNRLNDVRNFNSYLNNEIPIDRLSNLKFSNVCEDVLKSSDGSQKVNAFQKHLSVLNEDNLLKGFIALLFHDGGAGDEILSVYIQAIVDDETAVAGLLHKGDVVLEHITQATNLMESPEKTHELLKHVSVRCSLERAFVLVERLTASHENTFSEELKCLLVKRLKDEFISNNIDFFCNLKRAGRKVMCLLWGWKKVDSEITRYWLDLLEKDETSRREFEGYFSFQEALNKGDNTGFSDGDILFGSRFSSSDLYKEIGGLFVLKPNLKNEIPIIASIVSKKASSDKDLL